MWPVRYKEKPRVLETSDKYIARKWVKTLQLSFGLATVQESLHSTGVGSKVGLSGERRQYKTVVPPP